MASRFRCPKAGTRVRFEANDAAMYGLYRQHSGSTMPFPPPRVGEEGKVVSLPFAGRARTCMPGPGGGMVYVDWDQSATQGVLRYHLVNVETGETLKGAAARKAKRRR